MLGEIKRRLLGFARRGQQGVKGTVLAEDPLVIYVLFAKDAFRLIESLGKPAVIIKQTCWFLGVEDQQEEAQKIRAAAEEKGHQLVMMVNCPREREICEEIGVRSFLCNHNALLDTDVFTIDPSVPKSFDAMYDARLTPFKRHHLAEKVGGLSLITYLTPNFNHSEEYLEEVRKKLSGAHWVNGPFAANDRRLSQEEVAVEYNRARCGIILSELEGTNYATVQYLLCGLPVVSTPSEGGREEFYNDRDVIVSDPEPEAIARAVREMVARNLDPTEVRERALKRVAEIREVFLREVQGLIDENGGGVDFRERWPEVYCNKLLGFVTFREIARL